MKARITLKGLKTFRGMDGQGFCADVYIDDVKCYSAFDEGCGGETHFTTYVNDKTRAIVQPKIDELEAYIKTLPPVVCKDFKFEFSYPQTLATLIDDVINDLQKEKAKTSFLKKRDKLMLTSIVWGNPSNDEYRYIDFKTPLSLILSDKLQEFYTGVKNKLKSGEKILNNNIPANIH